MSEPILPPGDRWLEEVRDLRRRVEDLERGRRMIRTTQRGGTFVLAPEDGTPAALVYFGQVELSGDGDPLYGAQFMDAKGDVVFGVDELVNGQVYPQEYAAWVVPTAQVITSGTFVTVAEVSLGALAHDVMTATAALIVDAATSAEVRVHDAANGLTSNTLTVAGAANGNLLLNWLHPYTCGWGDDRPGRPTNLSLAWQVRRSAGAGNVTAYPPRSLTMLSSRFASGESSSTPLSFS